MQIQDMQARIKTKFWFSAARYCRNWPLPVKLRPRSTTIGVTSLHTAIFSNSGFGRRRYRYITAVKSLAITNAYDENSPTALIVEGLLNAASSGILIYMALVDLLAADFMNPKLQNNGILQVGASVSLLLGAGLMSLSAIWA